MKWLIGQLNLNNPDKLKELGENARTTALKYSKDEVKKMWIKLLG